MKKCKVKSCKLTSPSKSILKVLYNNPPGLKADTIIELTKIKQRTAYDNLKKLQRLKLIEHNYPIWKVCNSIGQSSEIAKLLEDKPMVGNSFSWVMRLIQKPEWWDKRGRWLKRYLNTDVEPIRLSKGNYYHQFRSTKFLVQAFNDSIIFMAQQKYWGEDAYDCFEQALKDLISYYEELEIKLRFKFFLDGIPQVTLRGSDYIFIKDILAKKCKQIGKGFEIVIDNKRVLWVDFSDPLGTESNDPESMEHYKGYVTDVIKNKPPYLSELSKAIIETNNSVQQTNSSVQQTNHSVTRFMDNWDYYAVNLKEHVDVLKEIKLYFMKIFDERKCEDDKNRSK